MNIWKQGPDGYPLDSPVMREQVEELLIAGREWILKSMDYLESPAEEKRKFKAKLKELSKRYDFDKVDREFKNLYK